MLKGGRKFPVSCLRRLGSSRSRSARVDGIFVALTLGLARCIFNFRPFVLNLSQTAKPPSHLPLLTTVASSLLTK